MIRNDAHLIDRLARRLAEKRAPAAQQESLTPPGESRIDRASLLRVGALGVLAVSLRGIPTAQAASSEVAGACTGGSLKACYATVEKNFDKYVRQFCDRLKDNKGDPFGTASYQCYVQWLSARLDARKSCRASCPKPKSPGAGRGGGGSPPTAPGSGPKPGCGDVDCVQGDVCCSVKGSTTPICCAIGCARSGDGCCSSSSDC
jgi:hypothetical protein